MPRSTSRWDTWQTRQTVKLRQPYARYTFESIMGNTVGNQ